MKAIIVNSFGEPEVMQLQELPDLEPGEGQVVVQVKAVGVNPVDTYMRSGSYSNLVLPYTPGMDGAGVVLAVGVGVTKVAVGERVYIADTVSGTYAQQALCLASQVYPLPERVSFAQGAAVNVPYATAYRALYHRAQALPGEFVLIHGASGGVGIAAVQLAHAMGMRIIGTAGTEAGLELVKTQGADYVLNHREPNYLQEALEITNHRGVDVILEMLANVNLGQDLTILAPQGRVVVIGSRGKVEIDPRDLMGRDASICGMVLMNASESESESIHAALVAGLGNGSLCPVIGKELPLAQAPQAHREIIEGRSYGKIVLMP